MQVFTIVMCWFGWRMWWNEIDLTVLKELTNLCSLTHIKPKH